MNFILYFILTDVYISDIINYIRYKMNHKYSIGKMPEV